MPTSFPSARTWSRVNPSPMSRSCACSSAARLMMRSSASRSIRSRSPATLLPDLRVAPRRRERLPRCGLGQGGSRIGLLAHGLEESLEEIDRDREEGGRVVFGRDLGDSLEIAQLDRGGLAAD